MTILSITTDVPGQIGVKPRRVAILSTANLATVTTAGYLNGANTLGYQIQPTDIINMDYNYNSSTNTSDFSLFIPIFSNGTITLEEWSGPSDMIRTVDNAGQTISATKTSATPGTVRSLTGKITGSATTMTSGNLVGLRGEANVVGASGGFIYGTQGKIIATGTLSGSVWNAAVFGQFDVSAATINAGQCAALWGDWGTTGATATDLSGCRGVAFTNTTSNVLNAQDYRYGNATYLMELAGAGGTLNYYLDAGTSAGSAGDAAHCAAQKVLRVVINGTAVYIPAFTQNT